MSSIFYFSEAEVIDMTLKYLQINSDLKIKDVENVSAIMTDTEEGFAFDGIQIEIKEQDAKGRVDFDALWGKISEGVGELAHEGKVPGSVKVSYKADKDFEPEARLPVSDMPQQGDTP